MSLLPLITFIILYLVVSIVMGDFYKVPITVAFLVSGIVAVATLRGRPLMERIKVFSRGASSENMMLMIWIFILAGAFASSAKGMGSMDATVNLTLHLLPPQMLMAGIFLASCFISTSIGTSVGTIVALTPIATGLATTTGMSVPMMTGVVVGGAFFGDNISFISDTTVVATQSQGCRMSDKFRANLRIVLIAALFVFVFYLFQGQSATSPVDSTDVNMLLTLPYLVVLTTAAMGLNVLLVLLLGCCLTGIIGIASGAYDVFQWMDTMGSGIMGMAELIIITMLAGGMLEIVRENGGIARIINFFTRRINGRRGAELSIAALVVVVDVCTANNTVAIITVGPIARQISEKFDIPPQRAASILDTFSCFAQGLIPYGAQLLMAAGLASINPVEIIPNLYYTYAVGICALVYIFRRNQSQEPAVNI